MGSSSKLHNIASIVLQNVHVPVFSLRHYKCKMGHKKKNKETQWKWLLLLWFHSWSFYSWTYCIVFDI